MIKWFGENIDNLCLSECIQVINWPKNKYFEDYVIEEIRNRIILHRKKYNNLDNKFNLRCISHDPNMFTWHYYINFKK